MLHLKILCLSTTCNVVPANVLLCEDCDACDDAEDVDTVTVDVVLVGTDAEEVVTVTLDVFFVLLGTGG